MMNAYIEPPRIDDSDVFHPAARRYYNEILAKVEETREHWLPLVGSEESTLPSSASTQVAHVMAYIAADKYEALWEWKRGSDSETVIFIAMLQTGKTPASLIMKVASQAASIRTRIAAIKHLAGTYVDYCEKSTHNERFYRP